MPDFTENEIPYVDLLELLEARASRLAKSNGETEDDRRPLYEVQNADRVQYVDDLSALGIKKL